MSAALSPEPEEPAGSGLPADRGGEDGPDEDGQPDGRWVTDQGLQQGLYVTAPAGDLSLEGFAQDGRTDTMTPGPLLAMILDTIAGPDGTGLAALADDQLIGFLSGTRRMAARCEWARMAALAEFAARPRRQDFAADEVAAAFRLNWMSAAGEITYAQLVARRLPVTFAALAAGKLDAVHVRIIEDLTSVLSDEDAAAAEEALAAMAQGKTYGELRKAGTRLASRLDPQAARKRKDKARREMRVRAYREASGNAGISGREMPSVEVLASMQHVEGRARALRDAGVPGTWEELKARALLDLLQERDSTPAPGQAPADSGSGEAGGASPDAGRPGVGGSGQDAGEPGSDDGSPGEGTDSPGGPGTGGEDPGTTGRPGPGGHGDGGSGPGGPDDFGPGGPGNGDPRPGDPGPGSGGSGHSGPGGSRPGSPGPGSGPSAGALITITVPHTALGGGPGPGGDVDGFGLLDGDDTRDLLAAAARDPATRWCLTTLHPDGTAATHDCAAGPRPQGQGPPEHWPPGSLTIRGLRQFLKIKTLTPVIRGPCHHAQAEDHYRPSRKLQHRVKARNATCTAPGCGRRAARCDLDHTQAHDRGGRTCECNLAPLCRHHHRCKQAEGWQLQQLEPGVLVWRLPSGRTYTTTPTQYAM